jgi:hypothetical protein
MKKTFFPGIGLLAAGLLVAGLLVAGAGYGQTGSNEYSTAIFRHISTVYTNVSTNAKDTFVLRRVETGILSEGQNGLYSSIQRKLFKGNSYSVAAFTDDRVKTFDLSCYIKNVSTNKWDFVSSVKDQGSPPKDPLIGISKFLTITVPADGTYLFEITANRNTDNSTARFAMMVYSSTTATTTTSTTTTTTSTPTAPGSADASTFFSIEGLDFCEYDSVNKNFNNCTSRQGEASLFELNAGKTMFTHTTSSMTSHYYVQTKKFDSQYNLWTYDVVSDVGNKYVFYLPLNGTGNLSIFKEAGNKSYMIKHHIRRSWTGGQ